MRRCLIGERIRNDISFNQSFQQMHGIAYHADG